MIQAPSYLATQWSTFWYLLTSALLQGFLSTELEIVKAPTPSINWRVYRGLGTRNSVHYLPVFVRPIVSISELNSLYLNGTLQIINYVPINSFSRKKLCIISASIVAQNVACFKVSVAKISVVVIRQRGCKNVNVGTFWKKIICYFLITCTKNSVRRPSNINHLLLVAQRRKS